MDYSMYAPLEDTLLALGAAYFLLDGDGACVLPLKSRGQLPFAPADIARALPGGGKPSRLGEYGLYPVDVTPRMILAIKHRGGATDALGLLAGAYIASALRAQPEEQTKEGFLRQCLLGQADSAFMRQGLARFGIDEHKNRYLLVLRDKDGLEGFSDALREIFPAGSIDMMVRMDFTTVAVVLGHHGESGPAYHSELADAIGQTALEMGYQRLKIGIGEPRRAFGGLHESYREAARAIDIGEAFGIEGNVCAYHDMVVERLLYDLPEDVCRAYYQAHFNKKNARLFNEETLLTVRVFMERNLNLSETARVLFIHRNTLIYRLDKIMAATGLDLRVFEDAASFKLLMLIGKRIKEL